MSGIYGILDHTGQPEYDLKQRTDKVEIELAHRHWYKFDTWADESAGVSLGRVRAGAFNAEAQPIMSVDGCVVLVMSGELYYTDALRGRLASAGHTPTGGSHAHLALAAYQCYGAEFAAELNGIFSIAVYDVKLRKVILTNDRFAMYPMYYTAQEGKLAFAPEVKGVLATGIPSKKLSLVAVAEFVRFQQVLEDHTFHEDIRQFPYAGVGQFDLSSGTWSVKRYWDWDKIPNHDRIHLDEAVQEAGRLLRRSVEERTSDSLRPGLFLSGGLDSRTLLGLMKPRQDSVVTATFGVKGSRDVYYAQKIARRMGTDHHWFDLPDGKWVRKNVDLHLTLTEGFVSWLHMHGITMLPDMREKMDYNITGWEGTILGHPEQIIPELTQPVDDYALLVKAYESQVSRYTWPGLNEAEERLLYTPEYAKQMKGLAFDSFSKEFQRYLGFRRDNAAEFHVLTNSSFRLTRGMIMTTRSHIDIRFPLWDYDFIDFIYSIPSALRADRKLYRAMLTNEVPALSRIPYDKDEFIPSTVRWRHRLQSTSVRLRRRLRVYPNRPTLYADYENYLRRDLSPWAESILFDPRTKARGIFDMDAIRSLLYRHYANHEPWTIGKISHLVTFEMMMRRYFDG